MRAAKLILPGKRRIGKRTSMLIASVLIGALSTLSAVLLKQGVHFIQRFVDVVSINPRYHYLIFVFPAFGIFLTVMYTQLFRKGELGRGVTNILYSISRKESIVEKDKLYSQMLTSILTVGFGGSAGLEAPIASTGSAIGSTTAQWLGFGKKERTLLLACGAAAGISAIFNAPIAGVVFAIEILLVDMPLLVAAPLLIASATASVVSQSIYSGQPFIPITDSWQPAHLFYYLLFALIASAVSVYAIRVYFFMGDLFINQSKPYLNVLIGGLSLGILIFFFPLLFGEGYDSVLGLLHKNLVAIGTNKVIIAYTGSWYIVLFTFTLAMTKVIATSLTVGSGGNGGMFGSSLFTGAMLGYSFAHAINLLGWANLNEVNFTVVGMAALMSGIIHSPLTAIFLIAEITGGYALFVPLMLVSTLVYMITHYFEPYSVYTKKLAIKGDLISTDKDKTVLSKMQLKNYIETDFICVGEDDKLSALIKAIENSKRNVFPVINSEKKLCGIILLDNVRTLIFSKELYESKMLKEVMVQPSATVDINENMEMVLQKFDKHNAWNLPVIDSGKYIGFVSKSKIFTQYRKQLIKDSVIPA